MRQATTALQNYLASNDNVVVADLYTFSLSGNIILRYIDYPLASVSVPSANIPGSPLNSGGGNIVFSRGPRFGRTKIATKIGVEPQECDIDMYPAATGASSTSDLIGTLTVQQFALAGGFDGGVVEIDRFFMPQQFDGFANSPNPPNTSLGAIVWFYGRVADVSVERSRVQIKVKSYINLLQQQQMPRRLFQSGCTHIYGDAMCGYDRINGRNALGTPTGVGTTTSTAGVGSNQGAIVTTGAPLASYYTLGTAVGLTGANTGLSRGISGISGVTAFLSRGFPYAVNTGDVFNLLPGCDHTLNTCNVTMLNILRYGGFDFIPPPEIAL